MKFKNAVYGLLMFFFVSCGSKQKPKEEKEAYRPLIHFTPPAHWMNDPNGLVYFENTWHLFYQYYPDSTVWGPMHWGHATSADLVHWQHQPIALYPDSLGYIFSGSAVFDRDNTSGFGKNGQAPLVAMFTYHDPKGETAKRNDYQSQGLAYSLDNGHTWTKYAGNPVLRSPGIRDFRDPNVRWYEAGKKWVLTLATQDRITFYSSPDLKNWTRESDFGSEVGAHGGVWECPDLIPFEYNGQTLWVLLVSINPGGPNGGSATQYFTGQFDGHHFIPFATDIRWIDWGPDDYAGVTWSNTGSRRVFIGWMSNWNYGQQVPTKTWRSAMTVPRDLSLEKIDDNYYLRSSPVPELDRLAGKPVTDVNLDAQNYDIITRTGQWKGAGRLSLKADTLQDFTLTLSNDAGEELVLGYEAKEDRYFIDRSRSGKTDFGKGFGARCFASRSSRQKDLDLTLILDEASVEVFADGGLTNLTAIFFPAAPYNHARLRAPARYYIRSLTYMPLHSMAEAGNR